MDTSVNYLTTLDTTVFKRLFKFSPAVVEKVCNAYNLSHKHSNCQKFPNEACKNFHQCSGSAVVLECAELTFQTHKFLKHTSNMLSTEERSRLQTIKEHMKHLRLVISFYDLDFCTYKFLMQHLVHENTTLESVTIIVFTTFEDNPPGNQSIFRLMQSLRAKGVSVSLEMTDAFAFRTDFLSNDICAYLTSLQVKVWHAPFPCLPRLTLVGKLEVLQHLDMDASSLSTNLFLMLAQRGHTLPPLRALTVHVDENVAAIRGIPDLTQQAWSRLVHRFPSLQVFCDVKHITSERVSLVVKPNAPVVELSVSELNLERLNRHIRACQSFSRTLRMFRWHTDRRCSGAANFDFLLSGKFHMRGQGQFGDGNIITVAVW